MAKEMYYYQCRADWLRAEEMRLLRDNAGTTTSFGTYLAFTNVLFVVITECNKCGDLARGVKNLTVEQILNEVRSELPYSMAKLRKCWDALVSAGVVAQRSNGTWYSPVWDRMQQKTYANGRKVKGFDAEMENAWMEYRKRNGVLDRYKWEIQYRAHHLFKLVHGSWSQTRCEDYINTYTQQQRHSATTEEVAEAYFKFMLPYTPLPEGRYGRDR